ncbi:Cation-transporting P-type ATPase N-terminal domain-containing protein [Plasmodiophora brassicae]|uniref:P-type sodium-transporting ATPase4 n=1 Tax=Plasmodiophora brassicae TaxID=37360 RepID=A0A0G4J7I9_PLABS|nr:hypothetical protein PBRA_002971 [Plasmodiophora brassicae]
MQPSNAFEADAEYGRSRGVRRRGSRPSQSGSDRAPFEVTIDSQNEPVLRAPDRGVSYASNADMDHASVVMYRTLSTASALDLAAKIKKERKPVADDSGDHANQIRNISIHKVDKDAVFGKYDTSLDGLTSKQVEALAANGKINMITPVKSNFLRKLLGYVFGGFNSLMWVAMILCIISYEPLGEPNPSIFNIGVAFVLFVVIVVSTLFYASVDYKSSQVMKSIKTLVSDTAVVTRDGVKMEVDAKSLKPGDIVHLSLGQRVPADIRLVEVSPDLRIDRSLLTGESDPIPATVAMTDENPLETHNLALSSTFVVQGSGVGVVFAIGDDTVIGRIFHLSTKQTDDSTVLQREINKVTICISIIAITFFGVAMMTWGLYTNKQHAGFATLSQAIVNSIGCLTSIVPQGLPVCVALALTIVARIMAARKVLVKNLSIVESAGCMSVLCSDKTGTLTEGHMFVQGLGFIDKTYNDLKSIAKTPIVDLMTRIAYLCNDASFDESQPGTGADRPINGNSTDVAIFKFAVTHTDYGKVDAEYTRVFNIPFNSKSKWMMTVCRCEATGELELYIKGAPDVLASFMTKTIDSAGNAQPLDPAARQHINEMQEAWSRKGQRVLMAGYKKLTMKTFAAGDADFTKKFVSDNLKDICFVGLVGICDPPRADVPGAVRKMRGAGVRIAMVTGDFRLTAEAISRQIGIITSSVVDDLPQMRARKDLYARVSRLTFEQMKPSDDEPVKALVLTGNDVIELEPQDWNVICTEYPEVVFARTTPEQKMLIVEEFKRRGDNIVGVTGDGVNDAPALKTSDIGMAMGAGSDVAKEAAQIVLLNNDFASILVAIENGRLVFENLKKVSLYVMPGGSYTEMMGVITNVFLGMQIPLTSYQQVIFCILHDVTMSISLMFEKPESDLMKQKPRNVRTSRLVDWKFLFQIYCFIGLMTWLSCFGMFFLYWRWQGFGFYDLMLVFDNWKEEYKGHTLEDLNAKLAVSQSIFYVTMTIMQFGNILATRNRRMSMWHSNPFWGPRRNKALLIVMAIHLIICVLNVYISTAPGVNNIFRFGYVPYQFWLLPIPLAVGVLLADETRKYIVRNYPDSFIARMAW